MDKLLRDLKNNEKVFLKIKTYEELKKEYKGSVRFKGKSEYIRVFVEEIQNNCIVEESSFNNLCSDIDDFHEAIISINTDNIISFFTIGNQRVFKLLIKEVATRKTHPALFF